MFRQIIAISRKELRLLFQKPGALVVLFIVPFIFVWIMGTVFGPKDMPNAAIFAVNQDDGVAADQIIKALQASENLTVTLLDTFEEADRRVGKGDLMAAVIIPQGFSNAILTDQGSELPIIIDPARSERASIVVGLVSQAISRNIIDAEVNRSVQSSSANALSASADTMDMDNQAAFTDFMQAAIQGVVSAQVDEALKNPLIKVKLVSAIEQSQQQKPPSVMQLLVPGYSLMFLFFLVSDIATLVVQERQLGTLRRVLTSPVKKFVILAGKVIPYFLVGICQLLVVFLISSLIFNFSLGSSIPALMLMIIACAISVTGFGIMIAAIAKTEGQASGLTILVVLIMAVAGGAISPNIKVPTLEYLTPHYWTIKGFQNLFILQQGLESIWLPAGIITALGLAFFIIGMLKFRYD